MYTRLWNFLEESQILYDRQFGFCKEHSPNHALISMVEEIRKKLDNKLYSYEVFMVLKKAFDTVSRKILIQKLEYYVGRGLYNNWLKSHLSDRKQAVELGDSISRHKVITCGVPQESILGPLLYLICINDMNKAVKKVHCIPFSRRFLFIVHKKIFPKNKQIMNKELSFLLNSFVRIDYVGKTEFIIFRPYTNIKEHIYLKRNRITIK